MRITVNGEARELADGTTVSALIEQMGLAESICAAEVNKSVVRRDARDAHQLAEGDAVEIVTLVGGG
ncbi:MAG: sulfur carrier protein ThiS [Planctomycetota bacterium]